MSRTAQVITADTDEYMSFATEQTTGGHVWDAARCMLSYFEANAELLAAVPRILELGAGTGFLGMSLACRFSVEQMVLTEMVHGGALDWLEHNVERNRQAGLELQAVRTAALDWSWVDKGAALDKTGEQALAELLATQYDYVIGSDLVYNEIGVEKLPRVIAALASNGRARVLYAHTLNRFEFFDRDFFEALATAGLECMEVWPADGELVTDFGSAAADRNDEAARCAEEEAEQDGFSGELFPEQRVIVIEMRMRR